jgi:hypothetical protein
MTVASARSSAGDTGFEEFQAPAVRHHECMPRSRRGITGITSSDAQSAKSESFCTTPH